MDELRPQNHCTEYKSYHSTDNKFFIFSDKNIF